jgi:hypothetical protein
MTDRTRREPAPSGYRHLGLWSASVPRFTAAASPGRLRRIVEREERRAGLVNFEARGLDELPAPLAFEYAHVYLGLRRRYPAVMPDFVAFRERLVDASGETVMYDAAFPTAHYVAATTGIPDPVELSEFVEAHLYESICEELFHWPRRSPDRPRDLSCTGSIRLSRCLGHRRCLESTLRKMEHKAASAERWGSSRYMARLATTFPSAVLVHEFGHLLDAAIWAAGDDVAADVYTALSEVLLDDGAAARPVTAWSRNLINYPSATLPPGPAAGGRHRAALLRRSKRYELAERVGRYAVESRDELFAETFQFAVCGGEPSLRSGWLAEVEPVLVAAGIARRR